MSEAFQGISVQGHANGLIIHLGGPVEESCRMRWMINCLTLCGEEYVRLRTLERENPEEYQRACKMGPPPTIVELPKP